MLRKIALIVDGCLIDTKVAACKTKRREVMKLWQNLYNLKNIKKEVYFQTYIWEELIINKQKQDADKI